MSTPAPPQHSPPGTAATTTLGNTTQRVTRKRTHLSSSAISLWGWPSRGGVIVLDSPTPPDFTFLSLNPLSPPLSPQYTTDPSAEDAFCQSLLRLGATWWDSEARRGFVKGLAAHDEDAVAAFDLGEEAAPTKRERRWVRVAWPREPAGALCVAEFETRVRGFEETKNFVPGNAGLVSLARDMDERYEVLQQVGGTVYGSIGEYAGDFFLRAWEEGKCEGEVGPLVKL